MDKLIQEMQKVNDQWAEVLELIRKCQATQEKALTKLIKLLNSHE